MMKKITISAGLILCAALFATAASAQSYECYRYVNGKPTGSFVNIKAGSKSEAADKALEKMKELGGRVDYAKCRIKI